MVYNRYYLNTLFRIIALALTNLGFFYFIFAGGRFFTTVFLGVLILIQVIWLFYYINMINLNLSRFLLMLGEEETSILPLKSRVEKTFGGIQHSFDRLNKEMLQSRLEREYASVLVHHVVDHLGSGLMAWDQLGNIEIINDTGLKTFNLKELKNLKHLNEIDGGLVEWLLNLGPAGKGIWEHMPLSSSGNVSNKVSLTFRSAQFLLGKKQITLVSFQNIQDEIEETEMESWEKLIRVLTHEVSNSVTPITTLGSNIRRRIQASQKQDSGEIILSGDLAVDIERSAELIEQRGNGLIEFIGQYKTFMQLPEQAVNIITVHDLLGDACNLGENLDSEVPFQLSYNVSPSDLKCLADRKLIEQVLLNMIKNSLEAFTPGKKGSIDIVASSREPDLISIQITDNGTGIPAEIHEHIFIPFFTTKNKGSGIGLSFCRRILNMNGGDIRMTSTSDAGTVFRISLPLAE